MTVTLPPLSLYVHIPWCVRKCPYCDFNSHQVRDELPETAYLEALIQDFDSEWTATAREPRPIETIFIGGGTPSLFQADTYRQLLEHIKSRAVLAADAEITIEANPGTFEIERFRGYRTAGINRISLGIQSFKNNALQALGRIHSANEAITAATEARKIFDRVNLDLMHGLPNQRPEDALSDLKQAIALNPDQISWYQLTLEPNTEFHARPPKLPIEEDLWEIQESGQQLLEAAGYHQYEISAYARSGDQGSHNLNYWRFGDYLGIGAGAHGKISRIVEDHLEVVRRHKQRQPKGYMNPASRLAGEQQVSSDELAFEFMLNALRLSEGVERSLFEQRTGLCVSTIQAELDSAISRGMLDQDPQLIKPTQEGRLFLNDLLTLFLKD